MLQSHNRIHKHQQKVMHKSRWLLHRHSPSNCEQCGKLFSTRHNQFSQSFNLFPQKICSMNGGRAKTSPPTLLLCSASSKNVENRKKKQKWQWLNFAEQSSAHSQTKIIYFLVDMLPTHTLTPMFPELGLNECIHNIYMYMYLYTFSHWLPVVCHCRFYLSLSRYTAILRKY